MIAAIATESPACFVLALIFLIACIWKKCSCALTLDDKSLNGRTGILKTKSLQSPIARVDAVTISNGILGKIFGFHTVKVNVGMVEYVFKDVNNAKKLQAKFLDLANNRRSN